MGAETIIESSNDLLNLSNEIKEIKDKLCAKEKIDYLSDDFRLQTLDMVQQYLVAIVVYIESFKKTEKAAGSRDNFIKEILPSISELQLYGDKNNEGLISRFPSRSFAIMVHFGIDSYLKEIDKKGQSFYERVVNLPISDEKKNVLDCLAAFRNSFHSAGRHGKYYKKFISANSYIEFNPGEVIIYDWLGLYSLVRESVLIIGSLILER